MTERLGRDLGTFDLTLESVDDCGGVVVVVVVEGEVLRSPEMEAQSCELWMCVPGPGM